MYRRASSRSSTRPWSRCSGLFGIHIIAPDLAVVPPANGAFSMMMTEAPCEAAVAAADAPAAPQPTTTTSATPSHSLPQSALASAAITTRSSPTSTLPPGVYMDSIRSAKRRDTTLALDLAGRRHLVVVGIELAAADRRKLADLLLLVEQLVRLVDLGLDELEHRPDSR